LRIGYANVERAMQAEPVVDAEGVPTGQYVYNGNVANKALELLGKEQGMFIDRKEIGAGAFDHLDDDELSKTIEALAQEVQEIEQALRRRQIVPISTRGASSWRRMRAGWPRLRRLQPRVRTGAEILLEIGSS
jgi:hypothetical protein